MRQGRRLLLHGRRGIMMLLMGVLGLLLLLLLLLDLLNRLLGGWVICSEVNRHLLAPSQVRLLTIMGCAVVPGRMVSEILLLRWLLLLLLGQRLLMLQSRH